MKRKFTAGVRKNEEKAKRWDFKLSRNEGVKGATWQKENGVKTGVICSGKWKTGRNLGKQKHKRKREFMSEYMVIL